MEIFRATKLKSDDEHGAVHEEESEGRKQQGMNRQKQSKGEKAFLGNQNRILGNNTFDLRARMYDRFYCLDMHVMKCF